MKDKLIKAAERSFKAKDYDGVWWQAAVTRGDEFHFVDTKLLDEDSFVTYPQRDTSVFFLLLAAQFAGSGDE